LPEPGHVKHSGRGEIIVGEFREKVHCAGSEPDRPRRVVGLFAGAGVPCRVSPNIEIDMWTKMLMNCAGNAVTAIAQTSFAHAAQNLQVQDVMRRVIEETVKVGRASGLQLSEADWVERGIKSAQGLGEATSSTGQDIARGKRTEIDSLNGYIMRRGAELGIQVPLSATLTVLIKLIEERNAQKGRPAASSQ
jgi:2-dehydropantoate 2-reductase